MIITVTSIKLKRLWSFFRLSLFALHIIKQTRSSKGLVEFRKHGFGLMHYTLTAWESEEDLRRFARSGAHLEAMKASSSIAAEITTYTFSSENIPDWREAKRLLHSNGKVFTF